MEHTLQQIADRIKQAKSVVIAGHMRPDGDALGSALALSCALKKLNISTQVCDERTSNACVD
jgi:phosphoesterase RecJ-like protein